MNNQVDSPPPSGADSNAQFWSDFDDVGEPGTDPIVPIAGSVPSSCNRATVVKTGCFILNGSFFVITAYFGVTELLGNRNIVKLSLCALFNGATVSTYNHLILSPDQGSQYYQQERKIQNKIIAFVSKWTYETVLGFSQVSLNFGFGSKIYTLPFDWGLGALLAKDFLTVASMDLTDLPLSTVPPEERELLRTIGFSTRNCSKGAIVMLTATAVTALALTILNFVIRDRYPQAGDLGKIGLLQDLIAFFSGRVWGKFIAMFMDNYKERLEIAHASSLIQRRGNTPTSLKILRVVKNALLVLVSPITSALFQAAVMTNPNTVARFALVTVPGLLQGAQMLCLEREFENPNSYLHAGRPPLLSIINQTSMEASCDRAKQFAKKYVPSICFFGALTAYMGTAAATSLPTTQYAIIVLLLTTTASFITTNLVASKCRPEHGNRIKNELFFRFIYSSIGLSAYYVYLTSLLEIGTHDLDRYSTTLFVLALVTWSFWGLNVGNNRAVNIQPRVPTQLPLTPPIAIQELTKTCVSKLFPGI